MGTRRYIKIVGVFICLAFASDAIAQAPPGNEVIITVEGFQTVQGQLVICLSDSNEGFMDNCIQSRCIDVREQKMKVSFDNVPHGKYAICLFHDRDKNGELNRSLFGFPSEPFGFSNNPSCTFGPPNFERCSFEVHGHTELEIKL